MYEIKQNPLFLQIYLYQLTLQNQKSKFFRMDAQKTLFEQNEQRKDVPLAERMRPRSLDEFVGQNSLIGPGSLLRTAIENDSINSIILWGPPGTGKTTLAQVMAFHSKREFISFSAVLFGLKELREVIKHAESILKSGGKAPILFVDEIHRFNKTQQDAFLPHVERGTVILIGATTENPSFYIIPALRSRCKLITLSPLQSDEIKSILKNAIKRDEKLVKANIQITDEALNIIASHADGDARKALNMLETLGDFVIRHNKNTITEQIIKSTALDKDLLYDKNGEEHYNLISAYIKSMRGSDPDAAIYYLTRMLKGGEDPLFIARRMVIFASEDIGNADPNALPLAVSVMNAVQLVGMPEAAINLAHGTTYLACAKKSNASYEALKKAEADVEKYGALPVPLHIRNAPTKEMKNLGYGKGYIYPHHVENSIKPQTYLPDKIKHKKYYFPKK